MNFTTITVGSVTYALKAKKLLARRGIKSKLIKVNSAKAKTGCEYGVEFSTVFLYDVISELKNNNFYYSLYTGEKLDI